MKRSSLLLFIALFWSSFAVAQTKAEEKAQMKAEEKMAESKDFQPKGEQAIMIEEQLETMSMGTHNALRMAIQGADEKKVEQVWKQFSKDFKTRTQKDRKSGLYVSDDAKISSLSSNTVDVYAQFERGGNGVLATMWFDLGGAYLSSETHNEAYDQGEQLMRDFANAVRKSMAEDNVKEQEKGLKVLNKDLEKLEKENDQYEKKIEEAKELIKEMEANIQQNGKDQTAKQQEIEAQEKVVEKAKTKVKKY